MIDGNELYYQKAHRLSLNKVAASVTAIHSGQLFQLNDNDEWVYADGTRKAYPTLNDRYAGAGIGPQGERLEGRDNVSRTKMIACLKGNFELGTDQYDTAATFVNGKPLHPSTDPAKKGLVVPYDVANPNHKEYFICGFVTHAPKSVTDYLRYEA